MQGDACDLNADKLGQFNLVHGANLLCRLPNPQYVMHDALESVEWQETARGLRVLCCWVPPAQRASRLSSN